MIPQEILKLLQQLPEIDCSQICLSCPAPVPQYCCKGSFDIVIDRREAALISQHTGLELDAFCHPLAGQHYLLKKPCVFLDPNGRCMIHTIKPKECRAFICGYILQHMLSHPDGEG